ncbi:MAG: carboxymuconolactone decarboxylase family protein [Mizugakiibacter sp.]|uniref:carboxymuconolactone decarboxylase family protein n=1 Tax=Mizugakiibacter sp. TaxID=1972610 RepID=UPI0031C313C9|nr:carboxymuconolactone decarboxylase family protein [Xanthomonadaceae bacterium]
MNSPRLPYTTLAAEPYHALAQVSAALGKGSLGKPLLELVYTRASQINGCGYCLDMHARALRAGGEESRRLDTLAGWRESPFFSARERAALAWAEALTDVANSHAPDAAFDALRPHFDDREIAELTFAIATINAWNRVAVGMRAAIPA